MNATNLKMKLILPEERREVESLAGQFEGKSLLLSCNDSSGKVENCNTLKSNDVDNEQNSPEVPLRSTLTTSTKAEMKSKTTPNDLIVTSMRSTLGGALDKRLENASLISHDDYDSDDEFGDKALLCGMNEENAAFLATIMTAKSKDIGIIKANTESLLHDTAQIKAGVDGVDRGLHNLGDTAIAGFAANQNMMSQILQNQIDAEMRAKKVEEQLSKLSTKTSSGFHQMGQDNSAIQTLVKQEQRNTLQTKARLTRKCAVAEEKAELSVLLLEKENRLKARQDQVTLPPVLSESTTNVAHPRQAKSEHVHQKRRTKEAKEVAVKTKSLNSSIPYNWRN